jgi:hypothetical protein
LPAAEEVRAQGIVAPLLRFAIKYEIILQFFRLLRIFACCDAGLSNLASGEALPDTSQQVQDFPASTEGRDWESGLACQGRATGNLAVRRGFNETRGYPGWVGATQVRIPAVGAGQVALPRTFRSHTQFGLKVVVKFFQGLFLDDVCRP